MELTNTVNKVVFKNYSYDVRRPKSYYVHLQKHLKLVPLIKPSLIAFIESNGLKNYNSAHNFQSYLKNEVFPDSEESWPIIVTTMSTGTLHMIYLYRTYIL